MSLVRKRRLLLILPLAGVGIAGFFGLKALFSPVEISEGDIVRARQVKRSVRLTAAPGESSAPTETTPSTGVVQPETGSATSTGGPPQASRSPSAPSVAREAAVSYDTPQGIRELAGRMIDEARPEEAVRLYQEALADNPNDPSLRMELGLAYVESGNLEMARQVFEQRLVEAPNDPEAWFGLGAVERADGNHEAAIGHFNEVLQNDPNHVDAKFNMAEILTFEKKDGGTAAEKVLAEKFYNELLTQMPGDLDLTNGLAAVQLSTGRADEAVRTWEGLVQEHPEESVLHSNLAEAYLASERPEDALQATSKALELDPENSDAHFYMGLAQIEKGNQSAGVAEIRRAAELEPENPDYQRKLREVSQ